MKNDLISREWLLDVIENVIEWDTEKDRNRAIHQVRELTPAVDSLDRVNYLEECIFKALDALDRGNDNYWTRKALEEAVDA